MNCQELRSYLQEHPRAALWPRFEKAEISSHLAACTECAEMVKRQGELAESLRLVRGSECKVPATLDAAVLANYRRQISELKATSAVSARRFRPVAVFACSAVAAALVFAAILFFSPRRGVTTITTLPTELPTESTVQNAEKPTVDIAKVVPRPKRVAARNEHDGRSGRLSARMSEPRLPQEAFRSLMYCDELSCSDAMEMIRLQLPASYVTRPMPASVPANGVVTADVLVGPDGIARGIRIEE